MTKLNVVLECFRLPCKKRSNFIARERSVFEITPADLRHVNFCLYTCTLVRLITRETTRKRVKRWFGVERGRSFDCIALISVIIVFALVFEIGSTDVELLALNDLSYSANFHFAVAECGRKFSSVVRRKFNDILF